MSLRKQGLELSRVAAKTFPSNDTFLCKIEIEMSNSKGFVDCSMGHLPQSPIGNPPLSNRVISLDQWSGTRRQRHSVFTVNSEIDQSVKTQTFDKRHKRCRCVNLQLLERHTKRKVHFPIVHLEQPQVTKLLFITVIHQSSLN